MQANTEGYLLSRSTFSFTWLLFIYVLQIGFKKVISSLDYQLEQNTKSILHETVFLLSQSLSIILRGIKKENWLNHVKNKKD